MGGARFASATEQDISQILEDRDSNNTKTSLERHRICLQSTRSISLIAEYTNEELNEVLRKFYCALRKKDGTLYAKKSLISIRYGLQKVFEKSHSIDIINDPMFKEANNVFAASMVKVKKEGLGEMKHKEVITETDLKKLYESGVFNSDNPKTLQQKVFFKIMLYFCNRGRENLRQMQKSDYAIQTDQEGKRFVTSTVSRLTKNHRGGTEDDDIDGGRMYEQPGNPHCPVLSFEKYIAKLNIDCSALWQRPNQNITSAETEASSDIWYDNMVLGKNTLGTMMSNISKEAGLASIYSNHCIRATCITILDDSGWESRHIIGISKHKSEASLKHYSAKRSVQRKEQISNTFAQKLAVDVSTTKSTENQVSVSNMSDVQDVIDVDKDLLDILSNDEIFKDNLTPVSVIPQSQMQNVHDVVVPKAVGDSCSGYKKQQAIAYTFHNCNITINN